MSKTTKTLVFEDNHLAQQLFGPHNRHLVRIGQELAAELNSRGNEVQIEGKADAVETAAEVLLALYDRLQRGDEIAKPEVEAALRMGAAPETMHLAAEVVVHTQKRKIAPRSATQATYLKSIDECELVFGVGPAGTGKTYLAVAKAVEAMVRETVDRIILSRPAVEAGEQLGFLPGSMQEKVDPYLRPLYDALQDMLPEDQFKRRMESGQIEVAPLAFMRGRTLSNAFVILDEAQNTTAVQMKMFLTRLGENSRMVVTGDLSQVDLPRGTRSGLRDATEILAGVKGVGFTEFDQSDVVRHALVSRIVSAYDRAEVRRRAAAPYEHAAKANGTADKGVEKPTDSGDRGA